MPDRLLRRLSAAAVLCLLAATGPVGARSSSSVFYPWAGKPLMVSNHGVYRAHEFIYQDYLYDDHGANTDGIDRTDLPFGVWPNATHPTDPRLSPTGGATRFAGDFMYASPDGTHMANVADLIEFRVAATASDVFYRIVLGDMTSANSTVVGICVDQDRLNATGLQSWPYGAKITARLGCEHLYTVYGNGAWVTDAAGHSTSLAALGGGVLANVAAATIDVRVPRSVADPASGTWRYTVASGIWSKGKWLTVLPLPQLLGAPIPTGGGLLAPNAWDLLSNNDEPNSYWDEEKQANDLARQDLIGDYVDVDFARLAGPDESDPQLTGVLERIYVSAHPMSPARGIDIDRSLGTNFKYLGPYQPYAMVVPEVYYAKPGAYALDFCMHPLNGNHNVEIYYAEAFSRDFYTPVTTGTLPQTGYLGFTQINAQIERLGALYACVLGRGEGVGYVGGDGLVDVVEVQRDVEAHYAVDPNRRTIHGVSLGAIGTWYVSALSPDRYSAAMPYIFSPGIPVVSPNDPLFANYYNLPIVYSIGTLDEFGQGTQGDPTADQLESFGDEYLYVHYLLRQHEGRIEQDVLPFSEKFGYSRVRVENPARVRYVFDPSRFSPKEPGAGAAYWVSGMAQRSTASPASIDVTSLERTSQLPAKQVVIDGLFLNTAQGWVSRIRGLFRMSMAQFNAMWQPAQWEPGWRQLRLVVKETTLPVPAAGNGFTLTAANLGRATLDVARMSLSTSAPITGTLKGDGATTLTLLGAFGAGTTADLDGSPVAVTAVPGGISLILSLAGSGAHTLHIVPA